MDANFGLVLILLNETNSTLLFISTIALLNSVNQNAMSTTIFHKVFRINLEVEHNLPNSKTIFRYYYKSFVFLSLNAYMVSAFVKPGKV